jgi:hypothetical protein
MGFFSECREIWLTETEAWLPSDGLKLYTDGSLFEGRAGSEVFSEQLDLKTSFVFETFTTVFFACSDYCLMEYDWLNDLHLLV